MIENFQHYLEANLARKVRPDRAQAKSLIEKAMNRAKYVKKQAIDESNADYVFEDVYEAMREAAQSLMSLKGYKPYSHQALISFLREFYKFPESDISKFDRYRVLRNKTVYSAETVSVSTCLAALAFMERFLARLKAEYDKSV